MKSNGLILGVLGGMGPAATAEFMRLIAEKAPASCDQEHPRVIVFSNTITPNRTDFILGKGPDPTPFLLDGLNKLLSWGADLLAVTCNTSHYYINLFPENIKSKLISIIDETIDKGRIISPNGAWLTATLGTMNTGIYQKRAQEKGFMLKEPTKEQMEKIHHVTDLVKYGKVDNAGCLYKELCMQLWEKENLPIIGACTELPIAYFESKLPKDRFISSLETLADACIRELYK